MRGALDVDGIQCDDPSGRHGDSGGLDSVAGDLKTCKGRMRTGVYQTSDQAEQPHVKKPIDPRVRRANKPSVKASNKKNSQGKNNATFV